MADGNPELGKQFFDIPMTEVGSMMEPHGISADARRKPVAFVERIGSPHPATVAKWPLT